MDLGLTSKQLAKRRHSIGGSDANIIMSGDQEKIMRLWQEKRGEAEPENLDDVLPVVMGQWTEELNRIWFARRTGRRVTNAGDEIVHPKHSFLHCTLDGLTTTPEGHSSVFEAKHVNPFNFDLGVIVARYQPQMQHQMMVTNHPFATLSVFVGNLKWECTIVPADLFYQAELLDHELRFWDAVQNGTLPEGLEPVEPPSPIKNFRTVDMTGRNEWAALADDWLTHVGVIKTFEKAEKELKAMVERDVGHAHGHGIQIKRNAIGHLRITVWEQKHD